MVAEIVEKNPYDVDSVVALRLLTPKRKITELLIPSNPVTVGRLHNWEPSP